MFKLLLSAMMVAGSVFPAFGEVEYEIHTGYSPICKIRGIDLGGEPEDRVLELRTYHAAPGKLDALLTRFRDHTCKLFVKHGMINIGYWVPAENPDNLLIYLMAYRGKNARDASWKAFLEDPQWKKAQAASEVDGKLVEKVDQVFMTPTDFSEGFAKIIPDRPKNVPDQYEYFPAPAGNEHLFEMRTYTTTPGHLPNLHARFRDHTCALFKKHGTTNLAYFQFTPDQPGAENTLLYFIAHKDMDSATKSWDGFRADPEWIAAKMASEKEAGGSLTVDDGVKSVFLEPTDFSPVK
jgi:hypothetical protein